MTIYKNIANTKILSGDKIPPDPVFISMVSPILTGRNIDPYTSVDGIIWERITNTPDIYSAGTPTNIIYGNNRFVTVGDGEDYSYWSGEGMYWVRVPMVGFSPSNSLWYSVGYGNGIYFTPRANSTYLATSTDGKIWSANTYLPSSQAWSNTAYGLGIYIVFGDGTHGAYSSDTITWTATTIPSGNDIICNGIIFSGMGTYSTDGITWNVSTSVVTGQDWGMVAYGNSTFVCQAKSTNSPNITNIIAYSTDGMNWNSVTLPYSKIWNGLAFGNGYFVIVGSAPNGTSSVLLTSPDGITWTNHSVGIIPPSIAAYGQPEF
jgi:hypothetical protein